MTDDLFRASANFETYPKWLVLKKTIGKRRTNDALAGIYRLWAHARRMHPDGLLTESAVEIDLICGWSGKTPFAELLKGARLLEWNGTHFILVDWLFWQQTVSPGSNGSNGTDAVRHGLARTVPNLQNRAEPCTAALNSTQTAPTAVQTAVQQLTAVNLNTAEGGSTETAVERPYDHERPPAAISKTKGLKSWTVWDAIAKALRIYCNNITVNGEKSIDERRELAVRTILKNGKRTISIPSESQRNWIVGAALFAHRRPDDVKIRTGVGYVLGAIKAAAVNEQQCPDDYSREANALFLNLADEQPRRADPGGATRAQAVALMQQVMGKFERDMSENVTAAEIVLDLESRKPKP